MSHAYLSFICNLIGLSYSDVHKQPIQHLSPILTQEVNSHNGLNISYLVKIQWNSHTSILAKRDSLALVTHAK